jgi:hypothetical protein
MEKIMFQIQSILSKLLKRTTGVPEVNLNKLPFVGTLVSDMQEQPMREVLKQFPKETLQQIIKIANEEIKKKAREAAKKGMQDLRKRIPKEEQKEKRKPYDEKYEIKRRLSREEASTIIQKQYRKMKKDKQEIKTINKMFANVYGNRNVNNLINSYLEQLPNEAQRPVGRPRKPRNPVGRPRKEN